MGSSALPDEYLKTMDRKALPPECLKAGTRYFQAISSLGLRPNFLGWGWDTTARLWVLVMVTPIVDAGGPLALNKLLFDAYNANATPREISPFIVRVFSPEIISKDVWLDFIRSQHVGAGGPTFLSIEFEAPFYEVKPSLLDKNRNASKEWDVFKTNVERLAA